MAMSDPIQSALQAAVDDGTFPGAVLAVRLRGEIVFERAVGRLSRQGTEDAVTVQTCYDLASLTKVLATTTALALLMQRGLVKLVDRIDEIVAPGETINPDDHSYGAHELLPTARRR